MIYYTSLCGPVEFANHIGWTDVTPYQIVRVVSQQTIEIREMDAQIDPAWKPVFLTGGFCAHCQNNAEQRWVITPNYNNPVIRARLRKDGRFHSKFGKHSLGASPRRFHDYNF